MTSGKGSTAPSVKGKGKRNKVKEVEEGETGARKSREVDKDGNAEELHRRKCQEKGVQVSWESGPPPLHIFAQTLWPESSF